jgi:hypothetical protein
MEDVLDVYHLPYDSLCPVICMDEKPYQLLAERREPIPMKPGSKKKVDNEYERMGTCSIFVITEPLTGWTYTRARVQRTAEDWAYEIRDLLTLHFPNAPKLKIVLDNLNTHVPASFYKVFPPKEARELVKRLEFHYTPKHGSWLNIAEITISVLARQCLSRRIDSIDFLNSELVAWNSERNINRAPVKWQFTTEKAQTKLRHLYPHI